MNAKPMPCESESDFSAGAVPEVQTSGVTMIVCAALVAVCFAAPLVLTLPQALDAAASPAPTLREAIVAASTQVPFHEQYPVQPTTNWVDSLDESGLAQWRMRASD